MNASESSVLTPSERVLSSTLISEVETLPATVVSVSRLLPQTQFVGDNPSIRGRYLTKTSLQISKKFRPFVVIEWDAAGNRDPSSPNSPLTSRDTQYNILACYSARQRLRRPFYSERPLSAEDDLQELASPCGQDAGAVGVYRVIPFPTIHESFTGV